MTQEIEIIGDLPELGVGLSFSGTQIEIKDFTEYSFQSNFMVPSDSWSFSIGASKISDREKKHLVVGSKVSLGIDGAVQSTGFIDDIEISHDSNSGTVYHISGRDVLSRAVMGHIDPRTIFSPDSNLLEFLKKVYGPYGWSDDEDFEISNDDNLNVMARQINTSHTSRNGPKNGAKDARKGKALKDYKLHLLKPYPNEGVYQFAARVLQREGLWHWPSADGTKLIVSKQSYKTSTDYKLYRGFEGQVNGHVNNIISGSCRVSGADQPGVIFADGFGGGGEQNKSRLFGYILNPTAAYDKDGFIHPDIVTAIQSHGGTDWEVSLGNSAAINRGSLTGIKRIVTECPIMVFLHDDESKTKDQLDNFLRRQLSVHMKEFLTARYTVKGHTFNGKAWSVDTQVDVQDEVFDLKESLYVLGRTFAKSRSGGTTTHLDLILPGSLVF